MASQRYCGSQELLGVCPGRDILYFSHGTGRGIHDEVRVYLHHLHKGQGEGRGGDHLHKIHNFFISQKWPGVIFDYCIY